MRTFLTFLALFAAAALISGLLTYPAWVGIQSIADVPIHRVLNRIGMLVLAIATVLFLRRLGLANKETLGYGMSRAQFIRQLLWGFAAGALLMLPLTALFFGLDFLTLSPRFLDDPEQLKFVSKLVLLGMLSAFTVAFLEETFCRGAMFSTIRRESGLAAAIILPSLLYAATHFLDGKLRIPSDQVTYASGLHAVSALFSRFAAPLQIVDAFAALAMLGILLALVRLRTGAIAGSVGLHAGGAAAIWILSGLTVSNPDASLAWLSGSYRGVIGWLAFVWFGLIASAYWWWSGRATASSVIAQGIPSPQPSPATGRGSGIDNAKR
ncbi:MAG TPA: CPBP family intramembrane glutamic endopeptidase [Steroidobacteraceae bacterium]|nr:CPBP family intramembrane glutamic endopeptidase [Steroidobacteraceae bacterium]